MKSMIFSVIAAVGLTVAGSVMAADVLIPADKLALIKKNKLLCHTCHKIEGKLIGPPWMDVSKKYKGQKTYTFGGEGYKDFKRKTHPEEVLPLVEGLMKKVSFGGNGGGIGNWKETHGISAPMFANDPKGKKQDVIKTLVKFVLSLDK
jgi:cytochrome c